MASFAYGSGREPVAFSLLDEKGAAAVTTRISRDAAGRPVAIDDGRVQKSVAYNRFGYPVEVKDVFGNATKICYNTFNVPVKVVDVNGIVTEYEYNADGLVTSVTRRDGAETLASVSVAYDESARPVSVRDQDGRVTAFDRDAFGRVLKEKFADGSEVAYTYDAFGRRTSVLDENGHRIAFDWNRFGLSSRTTRYEYDAAGRLVREGNKTYTYGYLDKVMSVRDGANTYTYTYHPDGQLATADYGRARTPAAPQGEEDSPSFETFTWDGLALIQRGNEQFINEPHVGGGNPVASSKGTSFFNDALGTTVGSKSGKQYSAATLSAFGEDLNHHSSTSTSHFNSSSFFTGKPHVAGLGHAFLMRNYRASLGKWQTADPMGYPDGWNQLAYCRNGVTGSVDLWGCSKAEDDALNDLLNTYKKLGANGNKQSLLDENDLTERNAQGIKNICSDAEIIYEDVGCVDLVEIKGSPYPHGVSYWSGDHKYQDWWQDAHKTQYRCSAYYALIPENALEVLMTQIIGGSATVIGSASYFGAALGTGAIGAGVAVGGLGAFIGSLFADKYVKVYLGLEFKKYYECEITLVEKRLIE